MDADINAFNTNYDVDPGLGLCTGGHCTITESVNRSQRKYFGVPPLRNVPRLVLAESTTEEHVGPGSYDVTAHDLSAQLQRAKGATTSAYKSRVGRLDKLEWSVPCDVYQSRTRQRVAGENTTATTASVKAAKKLVARDSGAALTDVADSVKKMAHGKFSKYTKREFDLMSWAKGDERVKVMPYSKEGMAREYTDGEKHESVTTAALATRRPYGKTMHCFGASSKRKFSHQVKKRQKDMVPEVCVDAVQLQTQAHRTTSSCRLTVATARSRQVGALPCLCHISCLPHRQRFPPPFSVLYCVHV